MKKIHELDLGSGAKYEYFLSDPGTGHGVYLRITLPESDEAPPITATHIVWEPGETQRVWLHSTLQPLPGSVAKELETLYSTRNIIDETNPTEGE